MWLYNTLTRTKEKFQPMDSTHVKIYVCGNTVYDRAHIGNARPVVVFDVLNRLLRRLYPRVTFVRNITDVDDKINERARDNQETIRELTERTIQYFHEDMDALGALRPDVEPRATDHIGEMIVMIQKLLDLGHAYVAEEHVLFHIESFAAYGRLSGRSLEDMIAGARVEVAPYKKHPGDFVLWKPSDNQTPGWDSPWGRGRPGWHIECSAMSEKYLGVSFDIHGGGQDLIFPHHENEMAQSCCAHQVSVFAHTWMHNGMVQLEGKKMSKSLGNFITVEDLLKQWPAEVVRLALLQGHYRQPLSFRQSLLEESQALLTRMYQALREVQDVQLLDDIDPAVLIEDLIDDLNTPKAIRTLSQWAHDLNKTKDSVEKKQIKTMMVGLGQIMGLLQSSPESWMQVGSETPVMAEHEILVWIERRHQARLHKDFAESDRIRDFLSQQGVVLEDTVTETKWRRV